MRGLSGNLGFRAPPGISCHRFKVFVSVRFTLASRKFLHVEQWKETSQEQRAKKPWDPKLRRVVSGNEEKMGVRWGRGEDKEEVGRNCAGKGISEHSGPECRQHEGLVQI